MTLLVKTSLANPIPDALDWTSLGIRRPGPGSAKDHEGTMWVYFLFRSTVDRIVSMHRTFNPRLFSILDYLMEPSNTNTNTYNCDAQSTKASQFFAPGLRT